MRLNSPQINLITRACIKASRSLIRDFGEIENLQVSSKGPGDFVTSADKRTEKILIDELQKAHPEYGIVTEEAGIINKSNDKNNNEKIIANNRRAKFDYEIIETYEAGICLTGSEVKSLRTSSVKLDDAHAQFTKNNELEIVNLHISEYKNNAKISVHKENRPRKFSFFT